MTVGIQPPSSKTTVGASTIGGTAGSVLFVGAINELEEDNANLYWNPFSHSLGVGIIPSGNGSLQTKAGGQASTIAKVGGVIFDHYADAGNSGTSETDLYSDTLPASILAANGDKITATYAGTFVSSGTATREIKVYFGGTVIFDTGALSISAGADAWTINVIVVRDSSSSVRCSVWANLTGAALNAFCAYTAIGSLTLTNSQILKITGQAAGVGAATNDIVAKLGLIEWKSAV